MRLEVADGRGLVGDVDLVAGRDQHRLQRIGHHLGIAQFGPDQDQDPRHRPSRYGTAVRPATRPDGAVDRAHASLTGDGGNTGPVGPRRRRAHPDAQPPAAAERHEQRPDRGDEPRARPRQGRPGDPRRAADRHRPRLLRRRRSLGRRHGRFGGAGAARSRRQHGPHLQPDDPRHARAAQADRRRDQRRGGGRRRQLRAWPATSSWPRARRASTRPSCASR